MPRPVSFVPAQATSPHSSLTLLAVTAGGGTLGVGMPPSSADSPTGDNAPYGEKGATLPIGLRIAACCMSAEVEARASTSCMLGPRGSAVLKELRPPPPCSRGTTGGEAVCCA